MLDAKLRPTTPAHDQCSRDGLADRPHPRRWVILFLAWAAFTLTSLDRSVWGPAAPSVGQDLQVALSSLGVFATCYYVGYVISNFLGGLASDWFGPRAILAMSMIMAGFGMNVFGSVNSMAWGLVAQAFVGLFAGADYSAGAKSISNWFSGRERRIAVSLYTTATSLGTVIANLVVPTLISQQGWRVSYHVFGAVSVILGLIILIVHRNNPPNATAVKPAEKARPPKVVEVFRNRDLLVLGLAGFCSLWGTYGFITWANTLMIRGANISPVNAGIVVALFAITAVFGKPLVGFITARVDFHPKYIAAAILASFSVMLVVFGQLRTFETFLVAAPLLGFTAYCYNPVQNALILDYAGRSLSGSAAGTMNAFWQLGSVIVPAVVGLVYSSTGSVYAAFLTLAAGPLLAALLMLPLSSRYEDQG